jgi:drug/metabolite transporter (DMT)-like permease
MITTKDNNILIGALFAIAAVIIWAGNFIIAKGVANIIPPISLSFYRWLLATLIIAPFAIKQIKKEITVVKQNLPYLFFTGLTGIALFNTCVYIAGHYTTAINLALIGTTTSPVFSVLLAGFFLKEKITPLRITGLLICIAGILFLISNGSLSSLLQFKFTKGDGWILAGALFFAIYNTLVRKKPAGISPIVFLFIVFLTGTLILLPFYFWEFANHPAVKWSMQLAGVLLYVGLGASVLSFLFWNKAVAKLGAARTALFGYLIPVLSSLEAVCLLHEKITGVHLVCGALVITGLIIANLNIFTKSK